MINSVMFHHVCILKLQIMIFDLIKLYPLLEVIITLLTVIMDKLVSFNFVQIKSVKLNYDFLQILDLACIRLTILLGIDI